MPLFRKRKTLWQIRELDGYMNKISSQAPPDYDIAAKSPVHQTLDGLIRTNWEILHSLEQDFVFSWFIETQTAEEENQKLQMKLAELEKEIANTQQNSEAKIEQLNKDIKNLNSEILNSKNALIQKNQLTEDLQAAIRYQTLGSEELKDKLEQRSEELNEEMSKRQEEFEASATEIAEKFKTRVEELDGERFQLTETVESNKIELSELEKNNQEFKQNIQLMKLIQEKLSSIKAIIDEIPSNLLEQ